jgi:hypothetical protein
MPRSDRAFRALAQAEPEVLVALVQALAAHVLPKGAAVSPDAVGDPRILVPTQHDADWVARVGEEDMLHLECQGYRDTGFLGRVFCYHLGFVLRYWPRRVRTVALWLIVPPRSQRRDTIVVDMVTVRVTSVVVPEIPAELLLSNPRTACFAPAADPGDLSPEELCRRTMTILRDSGATWLERHMAVVAAMMQGRYKTMTKVLEELKMEPIIIEDFVKYGEDIGFKRGIKKGLRKGIREGIKEGIEKGLKPLLHLFERKLGRPLTNEENHLLRDRFGRLGPGRVGDVVLDLSSEALAAWLADPAAV